MKASDLILTSYIRVTLEGVVGYRLCRPWGGLQLAREGFAVDVLDISVITLIHIIRVFFFDPSVASAFPWGLAKSTTGIVFTIP